MSGDGLPDPGPVGRVDPDRAPRRLGPVWRRRLRLLQLAVAVWTVTALVDVVVAAPAAADNCSVFTDCFGVANSAVEAAFGLSLLAALSMVLDFVPVVGTVKGVIEAVTGRDLVTGQELAPWERALGVVPLLAGVGALAAVARHANRVPDVRPRVAPSLGTRYPFPTSTRQLQDYRDPRATRSERARLAEEIGELGGLSYLRDVAGSPSLPLLRPTSSADVADLVRRADAGEAWDSVVAFNGRNATNLVYFDGQTLHIVEAKGGSGRYIDRDSTVVSPGTRISQTHAEYPRDVAADMRASTATDGRVDIGEIIEAKYRSNDVRYVGVRTGPYARLVDGTPETVVERVFLDPGP